MKNLFSFGNSKLPKSTVIFNFAPALLCASDKKKLCKVSKICYAKSAEKRFKSVYNHRLNQNKFFINCTVKSFTSAFFAAVKNKDIECFRFSESGDIQNQTQLNKFAKICKAIKKKMPDLKIYGYTARKDLDFTELKKYAIVNGSGFMVSNNFIAVPVVDQNKSFCAGDCTKCNLCIVNEGLTIQVLYHGSSVPKTNKKRIELYNKMKVN